MTELERLELVMRRVYDSLDKTLRFVVSDELYVLKKLIDELAAENGKVSDEQKKVSNPMADRAR